MVATASDEWKAVIGSASVSPIIVMEIDVQPIVEFRVDDYLQGVNGDTLTINYGGSISIVLGNDWTSQASNEAEADAIVDAFETADTDSAFRFKRQNNRVLCIANRSVAAITSHTSSRTTYVSQGQEHATTLYLISGDKHHFGFDIGIDSISPVSSSLDAMSRKLSLGSVDVTILGSLIRKLSDWHHLRGAVVRLYLGADHSRIADPDYTWSGIKSLWLKLGSYFVEDLKPDHATGVVTLQLADPSIIWKSRQVTNHNFLPDHPLHQIDEVLTTVSAPNSGSRQVYDATTLVNTVVSDRSHWIVTRHWSVGGDFKNHVDSPEKAEDLINQLLTIINGTFLPNEDGIYEYRAYDHDKAADRSLTAGPDTGHDIADFRQLETWGDITTSIRISGAKNFSGSGNSRSNITDVTWGDQDGKHELGEFIETSFDSKWLNCMGLCVNDDFDNGGGDLEDEALTTSTVSFTVQKPARLGFSGCKFDQGYPWDKSTGFTLEDEDSSGRYVYLRIEADVNNTQDDATGTGRSKASNPEIIAIDKTINAPSPGIVRDQPHFDSYGDDQPRYVKFHIADGLNGGTGNFSSGRSGYGTTAPFAWLHSGSSNTGARFFTKSMGNNGLIITDVTCHLGIIEDRLKRWKYGAPKIAFRTGLRHADLEIGDFITLDGDDIFLAFQIDGLDTNTVWEITKKDVRPLDSSPGVHWEATFVRHAEVSDPVAFEPDDRPSPTAVLVVPYPVAPDPVTDSSIVLVTDSNEEVVYR